MNYSVKIHSLKTIDELAGAWKDADYVELLKRFDYEDADKIQPGELKEYLFLAIADFEPHEAAAIVLAYKLSDVLTEGQIENISHEMLREKVAENYSDIYIHKELFVINEFLFKAYNGKFPHTKAIVVELEAKEKGEKATDVSKELILKILRPGLSDSNLIVRLFGDQLESDAPFPEAEGIVWELEDKGSGVYILTTSEKWLSQDDVSNLEYECEVTPASRESSDE